MTNYSRSRFEPIPACFEYAGTYANVFIVGRPLTIKHQPRKGETCQELELVVPIRFDSLEGSIMPETPLEGLLCRKTKNQIQI